jgi:hypothetical protein
VPPLADDDLFNYGDDTLRKEVAAYLDDKFLAALGRPAHSAWRMRMARMGVIWRLEVVYPRGAVEVRLLNFGDPALRWSGDDPELFTKIDTSVAASMIVGLLRGDLDSAGPAFGLYRVAQRLYEPHRRGVSLSRNDQDEPLCRILLENAFPRHVDRALRELGC